MEEASDQARDLREDALFEATQCRGRNRQAADVKVYLEGKTGTSEKVVNGRYSKKQVLNSFTAIIPAEQSRLQVLVMMDEPHPPHTPPPPPHTPPPAPPPPPSPRPAGNARLHYFRWNAVPTGGKVIARICALLASSRAAICRLRPPYSAASREQVRR